MQALQPGGAQQPLGGTEAEVDLRLDLLPPKPSLSERKVPKAVRKAHTAAQELLTQAVLRKSSLMTHPTSLGLFKSAAAFFFLFQDRACLLSPGWLSWDSLMYTRLASTSQRSTHLWSVSGIKACPIVLGSKPDFFLAK